MDISLVIKQRLEALGLEQRDLADAAQVTASYISQLLAQKKAPPAPERTDLYEKLGRALKLRRGELARLAEVQRQEMLKKRLEMAPAPLLKEVRELILRKCNRDIERQVRAIFEKQPFGELERLVTQKLLDVVKKLAKEELESERWLRQVARLSGRPYAHMRVLVLEFLDTDIFNLSVGHCVAFLGPLIESWSIDLVSFGMEVVLNRRVATKPLKKFEFVEREPEPPPREEPGLREFLKDASLSGDAAAAEVEFLKSLRFKEKRPNSLYFYRELQNLRDPVHFRARSSRSTPRS